MDTMDVIVKHIFRMSYEDLSPQIAEEVKKAVLDTMGAALAGSSSEAGRTVVKLAVRYGGEGDSTIIVHDKKVTAPLAALANGVMARCREIDNIHEGGGHVDVCIIPPAFAIAESAKHPVSGKDLILAIALGIDFLCRVRMAAGSSKSIGWMGETIAPLGIAATGAKLLKMDEEEMHNALGIAYSLCHGNVHPSAEGVGDVWLPAGTAGFSGIFALDLAREGWKGIRNPLLGKYGLYNLYFRGEYHEEQLIGQLGERSEMANSGIKPYPSCKYTHHPIYTTLKLLEEHDIKPEQIAEVIVYTSAHAAAIVGFDEQGRTKTVPRTFSEAQFSIPYTVATAIIKKSVTLDDFTEASIANPDVLAYAQKVRVIVDAKHEAMQKEMLYPPVDVCIKTTDGRTISGCEMYVKGQPENPFTLSECIEKFISCAAFSAKPLEQHSISSFVRLVENLETVEDVAEIMSFLS